MFCENRVFHNKRMALELTASMLWIFFQIVYYHYYHSMIH